MSVMPKAAEEDADDDDDGASNILTEGAIMPERTSIAVKGVEKVLVTPLLSTEALADIRYSDCTLLTLACPNAICCTTV